MDDLSAALDEIDAFAVRAKQLVLEANDDELVDVLGALNSAQSALGVIKRDAASEVEPDTAGTRWTFEQRMAADRSYNTSGLLAHLMDQFDFTMAQLIPFLVDLGVLRITWQWSKLKELKQKHNLVIHTTNTEISDGDPEWDVGEYWKRGQAKYVPIESE